MNLLPEDLNLMSSSKAREDLEAMLNSGLDNNVRPIKESDIDFAVGDIENDGLFKIPKEIIDILESLIRKYKSEEFRVRKLKLLKYDIEDDTSLDEVKGKIMRAEKDGVLDQGEADNILGILLLDEKKESENVGKTIFEKENIEFNKYDNAKDYVRGLVEKGKYTSLVEDNNPKVAIVSDVLEKVESTESPEDLGAIRGEYVRLFLKYNKEKKNTDKWLSKIKADLKTDKEMIIPSKLQDLKNEFEESKYKYKEALRKENIMGGETMERRVNNIEEEYKILQREIVSYFSPKSIEIFNKELKLLNNTSIIDRMGSFQILFEDEYIPPVKEKILQKASVLATEGTGENILVGLLDSSEKKIADEVSKMVKIKVEEPVINKVEENIPEVTELPEPVKLEDIVINGEKIAEVIRGNDGEETYRLHDKYQDGKKFVEIRQAFVVANISAINNLKAFGKDVLPPISFEDGEILIVVSKEASLNDKIVDVFLNGREIAKGPITKNGAKVEILKDLKGGMFLADTVYERAFKFIKEVVKTIGVNN